MRLSQLIANLQCKIIGSTNKNITHLSNVAQDCKKGYMFFCLNGKTTSGTTWAQTAINNGCKVIVCEQSVTTNKKITQIIVPDARKAMSLIASRFYGEPSKKLKMIGVTGTNGKTTTTTLITHILKSKYNVGLIGTNGVTFNGQTLQTGFTTPDPIILQDILAQMVKAGVEYVVMEYSAHAIYLQKLWGIMSNIIAFTNLSQDHLDYFENMNTYFNAKAKIFTENNYDYAVICTDTADGKKLCKLAQNVVTCSVKDSNADIFIKDKSHTTTSQTLKVVAGGKSANVNINLLGGFNLQNTIVAISVCLKCGLALNDIATSIATIKGVDGRFECFSNNVNTVIVDYAHTPDGLENVLKTANELAGKNRVICVFGCGGNRDSEKRAIMGKVAEKLADFTIITTDNPRFEDNYDIAQDICKGFAKNKYKIVLDRGQALREAIELCRDGDIVLLAGKGAENYTEINGTKVYSSDKELVKKVLNID